MKMRETRVKKRLDFRPTRGLKFEPLEESLQMRELYVRGIKHDINGLLTPLLSMSDYFGSLNSEEATKLLPRVQKFNKNCKVIYAQIVGLTALMADLQLGKRIDLRFDPGDEVSKASLSLTYRNGSAAIDASLGHTKSVRGCPLALYRAFMNILFNAHEAIGAGGRISIQSKDRLLSRVPYVSISFEDNGPGMDLQLLETVFKPGVTTKESGQGLGLFVVQHSVASFGGILDVESEVGRGTKFTLLIPATV